VSFDVDARDARFDNFLDFVTDGDGIYRAWLQKAAGLTLTGESEQMFFMVYGPSGSGKSTWLDMLHSILGGYAVRMDATAIAEKKGKTQSTNEESFGRAMLLGKRMVHVSELAENAELKSDFVKPLTGEGQITGRLPRGVEFEIPVTQKLWIGTNHKPFVKDDAIWRRVKVVPFEKVPEVADDSLRRWFSAVDGEAARAALAWMVRGAVAYYADRHFGACGPVDKYTAEYRREEDLVLAFISGMYEVVDPEEAEPMELNVIFNAYISWAAEAGKPLLREDNLRRKLTDAGHIPVDSGGMVVGLKPRAGARTTPLGPVYVAGSGA
jgi:putative DNA primase/helicase